MSNKPKLMPIRVYGDLLLRRKAVPVTAFDNKLNSFVTDLIHTMYNRDGVGLAANQVGSTLRLFVFDTQWSKEDGEQNPVVVINPEITSGEGLFEMEEGCISIPGVFATVKRHNKIKYKYTDINGKLQHGEAEGYDAVVFQHEYDHLNGILFTDRLGKLTLLKIKRKLKEIESTAMDDVNIRTEIYGVQVKKLG